MPHKTFAEMISTLRAAKAAGMGVTISLSADSAGFLADILSDHAEKLREELKAHGIDASLAKPEPMSKQIWGFIQKNPPELKGGIEL